MNELYLLGGLALGVVLNHVYWIIYYKINEIYFRYKFNKSIKNINDKPVINRIQIFKDSYDR